MRLMLIVLWGALAASSGATQTKVPGSTSDAINVSDDHVTRQVDCGGRDLAVSGNGDVLTVRNCRTISVVGSGNRVLAYLLKMSTIATIGNHNHIVFKDEPGFDPQVSSAGTDNEIVPEMSSKDMVAKPFVKSGARPR